MDEAAFRRLISRQRTGATAAGLRVALGIASLGYRTAIGFRNVMFDTGLRKIHRVAAPVISIGNITTGGTGKTPIVALVCRMLQEFGVSPGIISRGYRSVDGLANDEKLVLALQCPNVPHKQNPDRLVAASDMLREHFVDVIVMDDGFQHRRLQRDFDLVLIDATNPFGCGHVLPRGLLREPLSALRRADAVLMTRSDLVPEVELAAIQAALLRTAPRLEGRILRAAFLPVGLFSVTGKRSDLSSIAGQSVFLMSGIGNPDAFAATCEQAGLQIAGTRWFADHHQYTDSDLQAIQVAARQSRADRIVTTLKDLVKLGPTHESILAIQIAPDFPIPTHFDTLRELLRSSVLRNSE